MCQSAKPFILATAGAWPRSAQIRTSESISTPPAMVAPKRKRMVPQGAVKISFFEPEQFVIRSQPLLIAPDLIATYASIA